MKPFIKTQILLTIIFLSGCNIVELEEAANPVTDGSQEINTTQVNLGSRSIPGESVAFGQMLHNNDSKVWIANQFSIEGLDAFLDCRLDDTITLFVDGTYMYDGGNNLCGADDNQRMRTGNWTFNFETSSLVFEPGSAEETSATVVTLDNNVLTFTSIYQSQLFGSFDIAGRYTATN